jgi:threonine/homoserine/homoserine lactone efflux protein
VVQGFVLGGVQITVSLLVNTGIVVSAGTIAGFLAERPRWMRWQRRVTGTLLGAVGVRLALDAPTTQT